MGEEGPEEEEQEEDDGSGLPDVTDRKQLAAWLNEQPPAVSVAIAARAALRVLPILVLEFQARGSRPPEEIAAALVLPVFRAAAVPWVAANYPTYGTELAAFAAAATAAFAAAADATAATARAAARAATAAATTAAFAAATDATAATVATAAAARAAARAATAVSASDAAFTAADAALTFDVRQIADGLGVADLAGRPLWPDTVPQDLNSLRQELRDRLRSLDEGWDVWTDWYEARLEGRPADETLEVARATIADEIWKQGPRTVNAHIRDLIKRHEETPPPPDPVPRPPPDDSPQPRRNVWLAKFTREKDRPNRWMRAIGPGSPIPWRIGKAEIAAMRAGDPVVYWRNVKGRDRGGVVGTGKIASTELDTGEDGKVRVPTEVAEFYADKPLNRDDVIEATGLKPGVSSSCQPMSRRKWTLF
jgi:hypothetical protein